MKPTIVESQFLRAGSSKGSLNSHLLSKYRSCLEACFEEEELKEYVNKEHSFLLNNQREYSLEDSNRDDCRELTFRNLYKDVKEFQLNLHLQLVGTANSKILDCLEECLIDCIRVLGIQGMELSYEVISVPVFPINT